MKTIPINEQAGLDFRKSLLPSQRICTVDYLGVVLYAHALRLQHRLVRARAEGSIPDVLLLLEHPPVVTIGRFRGEEDLLIPREILARDGIAVFHTSRGGGITYHGPGQLVGYPILDLKEIGLGVRKYIWKLEAVIIRLFLTLGIQGHRVANYPGVWVGEKKVCSIGIHVSHYVTMHGFALNVSNDLRYFEYIKPCGIDSKVMTSISKLLGYSVEVDTIIESLLDSFSATFGLQLKKGDNKWLAILDDLSG